MILVMVCGTAMASMILVMVCGATEFDSMLTFSRVLLTSRAEARMVAAASESMQLAACSSVKWSFLSRASKSSMKRFSETGTLLRLTTVVFGSLSLIFCRASSGTVLFGASLGYCFSGVAFVTPRHPMLGSALGFLSDWLAWYWSWFIIEWSPIIPAKSTI